MVESEIRELKSALLDITGALLDQSMVNSALISALLSGGVPSEKFLEELRKAREKDSQMLVTISNLFSIVKKLGDE